MQTTQVWRDAWVEIDREKLRQNFMEVRRAVGNDVKVCAVLKAQCYGLGGALVAQVIDPLGADAYAVAVLSEAIELRAVVPDKEILVLGYVGEDGYDCAIEHDISLNMYREEALVTLNQHALALGKKARVHIKVNSGMNRLGFLPTEESADAVARCVALPGIDWRGIFTHLAVADEVDTSHVTMQQGRFDAFLDLLRNRGLTLPTVHMAASPAICRFPELYRDMVRAGLLLTGFYTSEDVPRDRVHLQPCVKLKARLGSVMPVKAGEGVCYGFTYRTEKDTVLGVLPLGFSDGFTRAFSNNFFVTIRGHRCPVVGRICMDHCMIDLSNVPDPVIGEEIVVYGDGTDGPDGAMSAEQVADMRQTVVDEVLTNLAARVPRILV